MDSINPTKINQDDINIGRRDIEAGLTTLNTLINFVDGIHPDDYDPRMQAILALAQKAGALLERGIGCAIGEELGIVGNAEAWMMDPSEKQARANLKQSWRDKP